MREYTNLRLAPVVMDLEWSEVETRISRFIKHYVEKAKAKGVVLGLSGGIDSSTTAALSARAIGGDMVLGLILPEKETYDPNEIKHATLVAKKFGFKTEKIDITATLETFYRSTPAFDQRDRLSKGNVKARTRMIYIYYYANRYNLLVCGSSDKSETMMGYFTKWGDVAGDISPIMDLYKTQVRGLAHYIGVPKQVIRKRPSPGLWPGQTAEEELGIGYEKLDLILFGLEHFMKIEEIADQLGVNTRTVDNVKKRWLSMEHKRRMLLTTKLEYRTVGTDFRLPRSP
jgi:NAD+ synthase